MNERTGIRKKAAHRRRRIILNNDGDDVFLARAANPEAFWTERCYGLEDSQVDSIFYSTSISFNLHTHNSKVAELFTGTVEGM